MIEGECSKLKPFVRSRDTKSLYYLRSGYLDERGLMRWCERGREVCGHRARAVSMFFPYKDGTIIMFQSSLCLCTIHCDRFEESGNVLLERTFIV